LDVPAVFGMTITILRGEFKLILLKCAKKTQK
jgi:hypothetical protein